mmetsp:Transcript_29204/g.53433  ORF Transcript_29204/g.53433 Transcript_29204/m.53433 type:complete len:294 (-) Transcript_29204:99-980(-)
MTERIHPNVSSTNIVRASTLQDGHWRFGDVRGFGDDDFVNDTVVDSFLRCHEEVTVAIFFDFVLGLVAVFGNVSIQDFSNKEDFLGLNFNVCGLALGTAKGLMDHDARIGERPALALGTGSQQKGPHTGGHAEAYCGHITRHILHGIVNGHACTDGPTRRINVERNILSRVLIGQIQELRHQDICHLIIHPLAQQQNPVLEQTRNNIHLTRLRVNDRHAHRRRRRRIIRILPPGIHLRFGFFGHHADGVCGGRIQAVLAAPQVHVTSTVQRRGPSAMLLAYRRKGSRTSHQAH